MGKTYGEYLALDDLLSLQRPASQEHDEILFIVIHQTYELWFRQILHETEELRRRFEARELAQALHTLTRIRHILKTIVGQVDILETMTPLSFGLFRTRLETASGFQSVQFREIEAVFGRRGPEMLRYQPAGSPGAQAIERRMREHTVWDSFLRLLAASGHDVPAAALDRAWDAPSAVDPAVQKILLDVYQRDAALTEVCEKLIDIDEGFMEWRYRHLKMVERTIGFKAGTGGSAGATYLLGTIRPLFPDLWAIRSEL